MSNIAKGYSNAEIHCTAWIWVTLSRNSSPVKRLNSRLAPKRL